MAEPADLASDVSFSDVEIISDAGLKKADHMTGLLSREDTDISDSDSILTDALDYGSDGSCYAPSVEHEEGGSASDSASDSQSSHHSFTSASRPPSTHGSSLSAFDSGDGAASGSSGDSDSDSEPSGPEEAILRANGSVPTPDVSLNVAQGLQRKSSVREALERQETDGAHGLLKFFSSCTPVEHAEQTRRAAEKTKQWLHEQRETREESFQMTSDSKRSQARARQRKHREKKYAAEIRRGERSPSGKKRRSTSVSARLIVRCSCDETCCRSYQCLSRSSMMCRSAPLLNYRGLAAGSKKRCVKRNQSRVAENGSETQRRRHMSIGIHHSCGPRLCLLRRIHA